MSHHLSVQDITAEADRVMTICNACRYCEGFCAVFPAITARREFDLQSLDYLANLCHNCTACFHACQYKPPHQFNVNVPAVLTAQRVASYERYAWPPKLATLFAHQGLLISTLLSFVFAALFMFVFWIDGNSKLFITHTAPGAFYQIIAHATIVSLAGGTLGFSVFAMAMGLKTYCTASKLNIRSFTRWANLKYAFGAAATLKHLGGGQAKGCNDANESFTQARRWFHQLTMWGFLLCFAATCVATVYELWLGWMSPFPYLSLPVLLGSIGGIGLLVGPAGLLYIKLKSDPETQVAKYLGMDYTFIVLLFLISLTGFTLLIWRESSAMGVLLIIHLAFVLTFFVTLPYSKFVHSIYRFAALVQFNAESS